MKKKNNNIKLIIIVSAINLFIGVLLSSSISYAAVKYTSKDVTFTPSNSNWKVNNVDSALTSLYGLAGSFGVVPVGTINSMMGNTAPENYLICDGATYNIKDYPALAEYFKNELGSSNYFGGDGSTTFAVPDLRGEFLRGSGTNSHTNQGNGANVGVHQDGTMLPYIWSHAASSSYVGLIWESNGVNTIKPTNADYLFKTDTRYYRDIAPGSVSTNAQSSSYYGYSSRPTNTSVLYVIASKDIYVEGKTNYSTEEQVVGTWIDGKPLYQKTIIVNQHPDVNINVSDLNIDTYIDGVAHATRPEYQISISSNAYQRYIGYHTATKEVYVVIDDDKSFNIDTVTIQYTKTTD